jgi:hypothetical protein
VAGFLFLPHATARAHDVGKDVVSYIPTHRLPGDVIKREMNRGENAIYAREGKIAK